jgi:hypothetical protein
MLDKLREHHGQRARHLVRDGEVWCPARESRVDMEKCFSCRNFQGMRSTDGRLYVKCQALDGVMVDSLYGAAGPPRQVGSHSTLRGSGELQ